MASLNKLTISQAREGLKNRDFTSVALVEACLTQISSYDKKIKAFITLCADKALELAKKADLEISQASYKKPLLGIPYVCKDNFSTRGIQTTAGSNILKGYIPPFESTVTRKLENAGAILLGKTNMDAFAHGSSTETPDFFKTTNPWDYSRVPGGSSGGSAAAVSADMCIFGIGSETAGSVRGPAAWCGITGLKPTYGRVSRYGVVAMASSTDSPGPLTKTVEDAAIVLGVIAGGDPFDATSSPLAVEDYVAKMESFSLKGLKVGRPASYFDIGMEAGYKKTVEDSLAVFTELGAEVVEKNAAAVDDFESLQRNLNWANETATTDWVLRIDADEIRVICPGYTGTNAHLFQKAANKGVNLLYDHALHNNINCIMDSTFAYGGASKNIERSLKYSRRVEIWFVYQDPVRAWEFTKAREAREARRVSKDVFIKTFFQEDFFLIILFAGLGRDLQYIVF